MQMKDKKKAQDIAEERMRLIAPLLAPDLDCAKMKSLKEQISQTSGVSVRTLERYCKVYFEVGYEGLQPAGKSNPPYKIPQELVQEAIQLRKELPSRSIPTIIHILEAEGKAAPGFLKRTTLQEALARAGYSASMMRVYQDTGYAHANLYVVSD